MARTQDGEYYYDAGTINEQLEDYEVYEQDGRLYLNKEGADPERAISFDGVTEVLQAPRPDHPDDDELADGETAFYAHTDGEEDPTITLQSSYNDDGTVVTVELAEFVAPA